MSLLDIGFLLHLYKKKAIKYYGKIIKLNVLLIKKLNFRKINNLFILSYIIKEFYRINYHKIAEISAPHFLRPCFSGALI